MTFEGGKCPRYPSRAPRGQDRGGGRRRSEGAAARGQGPPRTAGAPPTGTTAGGASLDYLCSPGSSLRRTQSLLLWLAGKWLWEPTQKKA